MRIYFVLIFFYLILSCANSQQKPVDYKLMGGPCEGCEAIFEYGDKYLNPVDTLPGFDKAENKIKLTGIIYQPDGVSPAKDVILYIYHTNENGIYATRGDEIGWGRRHGYRRGWIKTDDDGKYIFYTAKPGAYPTWSQPAHIHPIILEPDGKYYWINDFYFEGDTLISEKERNPIAPKGGSGLVKLNKTEELWVAERNIILGKNVY